MVNLKRAALIAVQRAFKGSAHPIPQNPSLPLAFRHFPCISRLIKHPVIWLVALRKAGFFVETVWNHRVPASRVSALDRTEQTLFLPAGSARTQRTVVEAWRRDRVGLMAKQERHMFHGSL